MIQPRPHRTPRAFSLIELVAVIAIIAIIASFTIPAVTSMLKGSGLTQGSQLLVDQLALGRQLALSRNMTVEVRFYRYGDPETPGEKVDEPDKGRVRALQLFEVLPSGVSLPIGKIQQFPQSVVVSSNPTTPSEAFSSIIDGGTVVKADVVKSDKTAPELPRGVGKRYEYAAFRFLPDGSTNLAPTGAPYNGIWYITLHGLTDKPEKSGKTFRPPPNFFTVQVDPINGTTRVYRPTAG